MNTPDTEEETRPWEELHRLVEEGAAAPIDAYVDDLDPSDQALALSRLSETDQREVMLALEPETAAELVGNLPDVQAAELIENLEVGDAAEIIRHLPSDEQADLIRELSDEDAHAILQELSQAEAESARRLVAYDDEVAGGLMITELLRFPAAATAGEVIENLADNADRYRDFDVQYAYLVDESERLVGVLRMRDLLLAGRKRPVREIMIADPLSVRDDTKLEELVKFFERHDFLAIPTVNGDSQLVGVVRRTAVDAAWAARHESDYLKSQGIVGGEELRTMPLWLRSRRRLSWLSINIVLNIIAASVIAVFQDTISAVIALAVFLPIISDMSGCSGNQAVAVSMRELAIGLARPSDVRRVWLKELSVGLINGSALGVLIGIVAAVWQWNLALGAVVGAALAANTVIAVSIGGTVPLVLRRFNLDPAVASGPLLTTVTDMCGFLLVLGLATMMLKYLV